MSRFKLSGFLLVFCGWLIIGAVALSPLAAQEVPAEPGKAAEEGFRPLLKAIPPASLSHFNFSNAQEVESATLGEGFRVYTIPPELIIDYDANSPVAEMLIQTSMWLFPVIADGEARTLVTVDLVNGQYRAVSVGGSGIVKEWANSLSKWPVSQGYTRTFVRIYQAAADFILISDTVNTWMAPLQSGRILLGGGEQSLYDPSKIIYSLQGPVRANIEAGRLNNAQ